MPLELRSCPEREPAVPPPPLPRTVERVAEWANSVVAAWNRTADALRECDRRRAALWDLLQAQRALSPHAADP